MTRNILRLFVGPYENLHHLVHLSDPCHSEGTPMEVVAISQALVRKQVGGYEEIIHSLIKRQGK